MVIVLYFLAKYPNQSLTYNIMLFAVGALPAVLLTSLYTQVIQRIKDWRWLVVLDLLSCICILATFLMLHSIAIVLVLQLVLVIINDLVSRLDEGLFFILSKNSQSEVRAIRFSGMLTSALSMFSPALSTVFISMLGYQRSLLVNVATYICASTMYLWVCFIIGNKWNTAAQTNGGDFSHSNNVWSTFLQSKKNLILIVAFLTVVFITNIETPLSLDYFSLVRDFSEGQIGFIMAMFSFGMVTGGYLFKYIREIKLNYVFVFMALDGLFSMVLVANTTIGGVTFFYTLQGIFAMFMTLSFRIVIQQLFSDSKRFVMFQAHLTRYKSAVLIAAYLIMLIISLFVHDSRIFFVMLAVVEITAAGLMKLLLGSYFKGS